MEPALDRLVSMTGWPAASALSGRRVLIKPNLLTDRTPEQAVTTHPALVRHVIRRLKACGAHVTVGDSPASAANLARVWERSGIGAVCAEEGVPLIALEQSGAETFTRDGFAFPIARPVLEADLIVNLPKVKSHSLTLLTAAVKNIYGTIPGYAKTTLHRQYPKPEVFGRLVRALWRVMPPCWTIADAVIGMEGQGPANGRPIPLGFLAASADPFALDHVLCGILRIDPRRVPYLDTQTATPRPIGDTISVPSFDVPTGGHLLRLLPEWLVRRAGRIVWVRPAFSSTACIRCGLCVKACPVQALSLPVGASVPALDTRRCISCSCCHEICPKNAIRMTQSRVLRWLQVFKGIDDRVILRVQSDESDKE
ncbi:MAG TPA: DUF362 domain-containing protein [Kiritimatiellia bacterium]|nr:DUF362 domain-containing protein [Kiritimatiellia bacterium]